MIHFFRACEEHPKHFYTLVILITLTVFLVGTLGIDGHPRRSTYNLIPLQRIARDGVCLFSNCERQNFPLAFLINVVGNILILTPVGFAVFHLTATSGVSRQRRILFILASAFVLSTGVEMTQLLYAGRYTDIDDVLLNSFGALVGAGVAARREQNCVERLRSPI